MLSQIVKDFISRNSQIIDSEDWHQLILNMRDELFDNEQLELMMALKLSDISISDEEILNSFENIKTSKKVIPIYNKNWRSKESIREIYNKILTPKQLNFIIDGNNLTYNQLLENIEGAFFTIKGKSKIHIKNLDDIDSTLNISVNLSADENLNFCLNFNINNKIEFSIFCYDLEELEYIETIFGLVLILNLNALIYVINNNLINILNNQE